MLRCGRPAKGAVKLTRLRWRGYGTGPSRGGGSVAPGEPGDGRPATEEKLLLIAGKFPGVFALRVGRPAR